MTDVGVFIDLDNLVHALANHYYYRVTNDALRSSLQSPSFVLKAVVDKAREQGRMSVAEAFYTEGEGGLFEGSAASRLLWTKDTLYKTLEEQFINSRPIYRGRRRVNDVQHSQLENYVVVDVMKALLASSPPEVFLIVSADGEYFPVYREILSSPARLVVLALEKRYSKWLDTPLVEKGATIAFLDEALGLSRLDLMETTVFARRREGYGRREWEPAGVETEEQRWTQPPFATGQELEVTVQEVNRAGAIVEAQGHQGFIQKRDLSWKWVDDPLEIIKPGETVLAKVVSVDPVHGLLFGLKQLTPIDIDIDNLLGREVDAEVIKVEHSTAIVKMSEGYFGTIYQDDVLWTRSVNPLSRLQVGNRIQAKVMEVNQETGWIRFGIKQLHSNPWNNEEFLRMYADGQIIMGRVNRIVTLQGSDPNSEHDAAAIELQPGIEGTIWQRGVFDYANRYRLGYISRLAQVLKVEQQIKARVYKCNPDQKSITLNLEEIIGTAADPLLTG